jgi:hypothetical protein
VEDVALDGACESRKAFSVLGFSDSMSFESMILENFAELLPLTNLVEMLAFMISFSWRVIDCAIDFSSASASS